MRWRYVGGDADAPMMHAHGGSTWKGSIPAGGLEPVNLVPMSFASFRFRVAGAGSLATPEQAYHPFPRGIREISRGEQDRGCDLLGFGLGESRDA